MILHWTFVCLFDISHVKREMLFALDLLMKEHSASWEAETSSKGQEIPRILRNPEVHFRLRYTKPIFPILINTNPFRSLPPCNFKIHSKIILPFMLSSFKWALAFGIPRQNLSDIPPFPFLPHAPSVLSSVFDNCNVWRLNMSQLMAAG